MDSDRVGYELLSSTRYDFQLLSLDWNAAVNSGIPSAYMLLPYHLARLRDAAQTHGWTRCLDTLTEGALEGVCDQAVEAATKPDVGSPLRVRITLARDGRLSATAHPVEPLSAADLLEPSGVPENSLYIDTEPTKPSLFTYTKTTRREHYDNARARAKLPSFTIPEGRSADVVLWTQDGQISETSIRNLAVRRNNQWLTPNAKSSGCLPGVMRRLLLEQGKWVEAKDKELTKNDLIDGETVMIANGVEGCHLAKLILHPR